MAVKGQPTQLPERRCLALLLLAPARVQQPAGGIGMFYHRHPFGHGALASVVEVVPDVDPPMSRLLHCLCEPRRTSCRREQPDDAWRLPSL